MNGTAATVGRAQPRALVLREWTPWSGDLSLAEAAGLARQASGVLDVDIDRQGRICVRPEGFVGRLRTDDFDIRIEPKVPIETVLGFLADAFDLVEFGGRVDVGEHSRIEDLIARAYVAEVEVLLRQGLHRMYREDDADLPCLRGRVLLRATTEHFLKARPAVACRFEEFTADNVENRALLAALEAIARNTAMQPRHRLGARRLAEAFAEVRPGAVELDGIASLGLDVRTRHYRRALGLARLVMLGMGFHERHGHWQSSGFLINMSQLFERLLTDRLARALRPRGFVVMSQVQSTLDIDGEIRVRPDIVVRSPGGGGIIVDAKYKDESTPSQADMYQMVAYCRALGLADAVLIDVGGGVERRYAIRDGIVAIHRMHVSMESIPTFDETVTAVVEKLITLMGR